MDQMSTRPQNGQQVQKWEYIEMAVGPGEQPGGGRVLTVDPKP